MNTGLFKNIGSGIAKNAKLAGMFIKAKSPTILLVGGIVGVGVSTIAACKATLKVDEVLEDAKEKVEIIHSVGEDPQYEGKYTKDDETKDLASVYVSTGLKLAKLYAPSVCIGALSIAAIVGSNRILTTRAAKIAATLATVDAAFKDYRNGVINRFGERVDYELRNHIKKETITAEVVQDDGTVKKEKIKVDTVGPNDSLSLYSKFFDESSILWMPKASDNLVTLKMKQKWANERFARDKFLYLCDVYKVLGLEQTVASHNVGWVWDYEHPENNVIDFGLKEVLKRCPEKLDPVMLLDFNVQGYIGDKVPLAQF